MNDAIFVTGANVSAKTRHKDNRQVVSVTIPLTQLNHDRYYQGLARNEVRTVLHNMGLNSCFYVVNWVRDNGDIIETGIDLDAIAKYQRTVKGVRKGMKADNSPYIELMVGTKPAWLAGVSDRTAYSLCILHRFQSRDDLAEFALTHTIESIQNLGWFERREVNGLVSFVDDFDTYELQNRKAQQTGSF